MKKTRFLSLALTGTLCVSLLAGCGGSGDGGGAAQTPDAANTSTVQENTGSAFKLGGTGPLTGDAAIYGLAAQRGAQIAVDEIKEAGGDIQFALKYEDDVNVPETAVNAYNALMDDGMQILAGVAVAGEHRAQRIWRDLRVDRVSGGTDEMMILATSKGASIKYKQK